MDPPLAIVTSRGVAVTFASVSTDVYPTPTTACGKTRLDAAAEMGTPLFKASFPADVERSSDASASEDCTRTTPGTVTTARPLAGIVNDRLLDAPKSVKVTFAGRVDGFTNTADAPLWNNTKSADVSRTTLPSIRVISHEPVAVKIPRPVPDASASIQPSKSRRPKISVTRRAYCCPAARFTVAGLRTPLPLTSVPAESNAFRTTDIAAGASKAIPLNSLLFEGAAGMILMSGWNAGSSRIPSDTPASLVKPAPFVAFTVK